MNSAARTASKPGWKANCVGGLYGMAIGRVFYGESMFSRRSDASKIALAHLVRYLETPWISA